ncbi:FAD/FMN-containing isoamyl alcohol oxidase-like protein MreA [Westerdykella ornata]|uniref:FAD/FMN-containing isoamyl alcohol oxidase-like protein MreA n=1 Tax=Westerdykella ornata TaxID=318751 RepID=A0A6A6J644_WESOR|nr:FAD/FMN-containing isoamyl alcohol oxidase-like protein MreA [Westerdykella ornata]KAF2271438.1 FAD/FMN-containing isoamyl alcohol oxidase-like protein MreA [Westerdykella ornata]
MQTLPHTTSYAALNTLFVSVLLQFILVHGGSCRSNSSFFDFEKRQLREDAIARFPEDIQQHLRFDDTAVGSDPFLSSGTCKTFPGDESWPSPAVWEKFNATVNGALIASVPAAAPCYKNWGVYDEARCTAITANFSNPYFHEADPTSNMWPIYQGRTCLPRNTPNGACTLGGFPTYVVNISTVEQIQLSLNFARNNNIRLIVKNTGHCYLGKSLGAGALSIWTHHLKDTQFIENYQSDSGYDGVAIKVAAGVTVREIYKLAEENNATVTGGICESVGFAGGYVTGGGHTPMSGYYGMAADNVEALQVVTADGRFVTASNTSHPDLFWALRGGGASTFGVVTSVIVRAHPKMPIVTSTFNYTTGGNITREVFWNGTRKFFEMFPTLTDAHTYSYFWISPLPDDQVRFEMTPFWAPNHTIASFEALIEPWFSHLRALGIFFEPKTMLFDSFYPAYHSSWGNETVGQASRLPGNRIFPRGNWADPAKFERMFAAIKNTSMTGKVVGGYHQEPGNRLHVDNAVSSAFRHTVSFLISGVTVEGGEDATQDQMQKTADELINDVLGPWREVAPESDFGGSYLNEANVAEPHWQESFYGVQYPRLLELKRKWDPKGVFYATTAVGSDEWEVRDGEWGTQTQNGRLCRV